MITKQELFNNTWNWHIVAKNPAGFDNTGRIPSCQYRTYQGHRCAIGASIPYDRYQENLEGTSTDFIITTIFGNLDKETIEFARVLQVTHDLEARRERSKDEFTIAYEQELRTLAIEHGLTIPS